VAWVLRTHNPLVAGSSPACPTFLRSIEVETAENYLNAEELNVLSRIVSMYLDLTGLQALNRIPMYMIAEEKIGFRMRLIHQLERVFPHFLRK
jgi:Virulence protein RhuM family